MPRCKAEHQIRKRIESQKVNQEMDKLCLDEIPIVSFTPIIKRLLESYANIEFLTMDACELVSLNGFPLLPSLISLELSDNRLTDGVQNLRASQYITYLDISNNRFKDITQLKAITCLPELEILMVAKNPATEFLDYKQQLFAVSPSLMKIDGYNQNDQLSLSSDGEQSYITDKYRSFNNMDELLNEKDRPEGIIRPRENLLDPSQQRKLLKNKSLEKLNIKTPHKANKRRQRSLEDSSSEDEGKNTMINQFKRKFRKQE